MTKKNSPIKFIGWRLDSNRDGKLLTPDPYQDEGEHTANSVRMRLGLSLRIRMTPVYAR